jgi:hypothetical protein
MAVYNLSPIFEPQAIATSAAALIFAPTGAATVPANYNYLISVLRVANTTGSPVGLTVWRVPSGGTPGSTNIVVPGLYVPVCSQAFPDLDITALWGAMLRAGDAIWMLAGTGGGLIVHGDGAVIQP